MESQEHRKKATDGESLTSVLLVCSPSNGGVEARVVFTFQFCSADNKEALREKIVSILQRNLKATPGSVHIKLTPPISGKCHFSFDFFFLILCQYLYYYYFSL